MFFLLILTSVITASLPASFDWRTAGPGGTDLLTMLSTDHAPAFCSSSHVFAAAAVVQDRLSIATKGQWPRASLATQALLSCGPGTCSKGSLSDVFNYLHLNGTPDETCSVYQAKDLTCSPEVKCKTCEPSGKCWAVQPAAMYYASSVGTVSGESDMMQKIYTDGPVAVGIAYTDALEKYTGGVFTDKTGATTVNHYVTLVGWGQSQGTKYWIVKNFEGIWWGEGGFARIVRGVNNLGIETDAMWAVPDVKHASSVQPIPVASGGRACALGSNKDFYRLHPEIPSQVIKTPQPFEQLRPTDVPAEWDWRNVSGINYLTSRVNQHIPQYCGSCWDVNTVSAISDRLNIASKGMHPVVTLSGQSVLDCGAAMGCHGGYSGAVYEVARRYGLTDQSCNPYRASEDGDGDCDAIDLCYTCTSGSCDAVRNVSLWTVSEYGGVGPSADHIKAEIFKRGPVACSMDVTRKFEKYTGGVFSEFVLVPIPNHIISIFGWGVENGEEFWHVRNSWGSYFGEDGFFRIKMHHENLGIQDDCSWAVPVLK